MKMTKKRLTRLLVVAEYAKEHEYVDSCMSDGLVTPDELIALIKTYMSVIYKR